VLATLPACSVHTVVTSPPYYGLRDYGTAQWEGGDAACDHVRPVTYLASTLGASTGGRSPETHARSIGAQTTPYRDVCGKCGARRIDRQLGLEATPEAYLAAMVEVFRAVRRVLRDDGTCWVNIGDSYASQPAGNRIPSGISQNTPKRLATDLERYNTQGKSWGDAKPKDLLLMPARLALALQADGWWVRSDIIWHKPNPMPESCTDRPTSAHEHVFLLSKRARYYYDSAAIAEPAINAGRVVDYDGTQKNCSAGDATNDMRTRIQRPVEVGATRACRNVWTIPTAPFSEAHFATFPPQLVERCIRAGTSERGCCAACGAPWVRVTERNLDNIPTRMATKRAPVDCEAMAAYLRERREALGLSRSAVDAALGTRTLYSWFEGRPAGIEPPTPEQWTKLKSVLALDDRFDEQIYGTVEVEITDHSPSKAPGVRTYAKAWNAETTTTGWRASCQCDADVVPCTVLDPFVGSGTTALVADRLQRHAIGIDLSIDYAAMAQRRLEDDCPLFTSWAPAEHPVETEIADLFSVAAD
jgi:DNA modification methylase